MKKFILTLLLTLATLAASANSVRYFTNQQAARVAATLDAQNELMIYCGFEYELATYVIVNEVWAEAVNSKFYEIWLFGFDAYTGEEIYMPLDLGCIWLYNPVSGRMYSAAQYLRFRSNVAMPNFYWTMPPYNPFVRHYHDPHFNRCYTYHHHIHRYGWRPPAVPAHGPWPYHPYYMRAPHIPAPVPPKPFNPGVDHPVAGDGHGYISAPTRGGSTSGTRSAAISSNRGSERTGTVRSNAGNPGTSNRSSATSTERSSSSATTRSTSTGTSTRSTSTGTSTRSTSTGTSTRSTSTGTSTRSNTTGTSTRSNSTGTSTRSTSTRTSTRSTSTGTSTSSTSTGTSTRSTSAGASTRSSSSSSSTERSDNASSSRTSGSARVSTSSNTNNRESTSSSRSSNSSNRGTSSGRPTSGTNGRR